MKKSFQPHLELIREALSAIQLYQPSDKATFLVDQMAQDAILMRLQQTGENLARMRHIDDEAFTATDDGSCVELIGLRNVISHGYHTIRPEKIWLILIEDLPNFATSIQAFDDRS